MTGRNRREYERSILSEHGWIYRFAHYPQRHYILWSAPFQTVNLKVNSSYNVRVGYGTWEPESTVSWHTFFWPQEVKDADSNLHFVLKTEDMPPHQAVTTA